MSTNSTTCWTYPKEVIASLQFVSYQFLIPFYLVSDLFGRSLFLAAVYKHSKKEKTYFYQVVRAVVGTLQVPIRALICVYDAYWSSGTLYTLPRAISESYLCIWIFSRTVFVINVFGMLTIFLAVCMAADRVFALFDAHAHSQIDHRRHQAIALSTCILLSFGLAAVDFFRFEVYEMANGAGFNIRLSAAYSNSTVVYGLGLVRTLATIFLTILLVVMNTILLRIYRVRFVQSGAVIPLPQEQAKRKQSEKTLLVLTLLECSFMLVEKSILSFTSFLVYIFPNYYLCIKPVFIPAYDGIIMLNDLIDFYAAVIICKQFRKMVRNVLPWVKKQSNTVAPPSRAP